MAKQVISIGNIANDGRGDPLRLGAQKINENFSELYDYKVPTQTGQSGKFLTTDGADLSWSTVSVVNITGNAATVTNGVYSNVGYTDPEWIASLSPTKVLPSQNSNTGKFLTTNGTLLSWATIAIPPEQIQSDWSQLSPSALDFIKNKPTINTLVPDQSTNTGRFLSTNGNTVEWVVGGQPQLQSDWDQTNISSLDFIKNKPTIDTLVPTQAGNDGRFLTTDGSVVSWAAAGGGAGLSSRTTASVTTGSLVNAASANATIVGFKSYALLKIQTSHAAWVRLYTDTTSQAADSTRTETTDPLPNAGVVAEIITTGAQTILISPGAFGFNNNGSLSTDIPVTITNKSGSSAAITITLTLLQLEI